MWIHIFTYLQLTHQAPPFPQGAYQRKARLHIRDHPASTGRTGSSDSTDHDFFRGWWFYGI